MTTEKHDPWALLREARGMLSSYPQDSNEVCTMLGRIDAALATHDVVPPSEEKVEWEEGTDYEKKPWYEAWIGHIGLHIRRWPWRSHKEPEVFYWHVWSPLDEDGQAATLDEAQRAAIAAARGMK